MTLPPQVLVLGGHLFFLVLLLLLFFGLFLFCLFLKRHLSQDWNQLGRVAWPANEPN